LKVLSTSVGYIDPRCLLNGHGDVRAEADTTVLDDVLPAHQLCKSICLAVINGTDRSVVEMMKVVAWVAVIVEGIRSLDDERGVERSIGWVVETIIETDVKHDAFLSVLETDDSGNTVESCDAFNEIGWLSTSLLLLESHGLHRGTKLLHRSQEVDVCLIDVLQLVDVRSRCRRLEIVKSVESRPKCAELMFEVSEVRDLHDVEET
jgi:hypothetical protein